MKNFKYFGWFIWFGFGITFFLHNMSTLPYLEIALKSLVMTLLLYVFVNYIYASTMMEAIVQKNNRVLITKTLAMSIIETTTIVVVCRMLEGFRIFYVTDFVDFLITLFSFSLEEWLGIFFITIILNFGFYGLNFFQQNLELQRKLADSQLQTLQAQINPHFMFNVLNYINVLINKDTELASDLLVKYADILRYQLYSSKNETNELSQEVLFLKKFIEIERLRWQDKLDVQCHWSIENPQFRIAPLLLIVLVENAFKHVSRSVLQKGYIRLSLKQEGATLQFEIENSVIRTEISVEKANSGIGLNNLKERLRILYPYKHSHIRIDEQANTYKTQLILQEI